jgi:THO complex subunit 3
MLEEGELGLRGYLEQKAVYTFEGHRKRVYSVAWNASGSNLATGSADCLVKVWLLRQTNLVCAGELRGHSESVNQIAWHPKDDSSLVSVSADNTFKVWDTRSSRRVSNVKTKGANINTAWSPDGFTIAVGDLEKHLGFYDVRTWAEVNQFNSKFSLNEVSWNPSGSVVMLTTSQRSCLVLNPLTMEVLASLESHTDSVNCIAFSPAGNFFATGGSDAVVLLWQTEELAPVGAYTHLEWPLRQLSFSFDGQFLATASEDYFVDIVDLEGMESSRRLTCDKPQHTVAWHPSAHVLAYAGEDKKQSADSGGFHLLA